MSNPIEIEIVNPNVPTHNLQTKIVTPSKETQVVTADEGYFGLREVIVSPPTVDGDSLLEAINSVNTNINNIGTSVNSNIDEAETNINSNIDSITVMLSDGDATPENIETGKIAYVKGQKIVGNGGSMLKKLLDYTKSTKSMFSYNKDITDLSGYIDFENTSNVTNMSSMFTGCSSLTTIPLFDTRNVTNMSYMFSSCSSLTTIPLFDTRNVTNMSYMFSSCSSLTTIPLFDTRSVTNMSYMFKIQPGDTTKLTTIPQLDMSNVTDTSQMFSSCSSLTEVPPLNTSNVTNMSSMFIDCTNLYTISSLDMKNVTNATSLVYDCKKLNTLNLKNLKISLEIGRSSSWGHQLFTASLIFICQECVNVGNSRTLTMGSQNVNKLAKVYVKLTGETEEDETLPKLPMVQCASTDEGAMLIKDYMKLKGWSLG